MKTSRKEVFIYLYTSKISFKILVSDQVFTLSVYPSYINAKSLIAFKYSLTKSLVFSSLQIPIPLGVSADPFLSSYLSPDPSRLATRLRATHYSLVIPKVQIFIKRNKSDFQDSRPILHWYRNPNGHLGKTCYGNIQPILSLKLSRILLFLLPKILLKLFFSGKMFQIKIFK